MMSDLFSSLDGMYSMYSWVPTSMLCILFLSSTTWFVNFSNSMKKYLANIWSGKYKLLSIQLFLYSIMYFLIINNLIGLSPYSYSSSSNLWVGSSMALTLWSSLLISGFMYDFKSALAHLAPSGAPMVLVPFLILIEMISILIRPLTLTVRLVANISAGHIVLSLMANVLSSLLPLLSLTSLLILMVGYVLFEVFVSLIQAYIFTLLISLYASEHP